MTRITNADQVLILLRTHLQRVQKGERKPTRAADARSRTPIERMQSLARQEDLSEAEIERTIVQGLLAHDLGDHLSNEAEFHAVLDDVLAAIRRDEFTNRLLKSAVQQLVKPQD